MRMHASRHRNRSAPLGEALKIFLTYFLHTVVGFFSFKYITKHAYKNKMTHVKMKRK